ncbi:MAG: LLM class F420-dependent oxidoreductase [Arenicellales bacterium]|nr:LLM class F420-dependent oxidoreductase [Arenicellales bacterium]
MRYGFYLPTRGPTSDADSLVKIVEQAERLGFDSTVIADHVVFPVQIESSYPYTVGGNFPGGWEALEQLSLMAFIAGKTRNLRLVTSVMILPYRNPVVTAKMLATIDVLSNGRVIVGVGVGWLREEFETLGCFEFDRRGTLSDEYLKIFKTLWTQEPASFDGEFYRFDALHFLPKPIQKPHPPIWIGGHSRPALRRVARFADGWHPVGANPAVPLQPKQFAGSCEELRRLTELEGRRYEDLTICFKAPLYDKNTTTVSGTDRRPFSGSTSQVVDDIGTYGELGVHELIVDFRSDTLNETLERMAQFHEEICTQAP